MNETNAWSALIAVAVPLLISLVKAEIPKLPGWTLPILAPLLGFLVDQGLGAVGVAHAGGAWGLVLGAAGVGLREVKDQVQQRMTSAPAPVITPATTKTGGASLQTMALALIACVGILVGCTGSFVNNAKKAEYGAAALADGGMKSWAQYYKAATNNPAALGTTLTNVEAMHIQVNALSRKVSGGMKALDTFLAAYQTNSAVKPWVQSTLDSLAADAPQLVAFVAGLVSHNNTNQFAEVP